MAKKYYAVKKGREKGVFNSWDECKKAVEGYSNAIYKSFSDYNMAHEFAYEENKNIQVKEPNVFAYIDGSYDNIRKRFSYAGIIFENGKRFEFSDSSNNKEQVELRNVAGELRAAMYVMKYALENKIKDIIIYYDYAGIEMWATNKWKANLDFTKEYVNYARLVMKEVNIIFKKVKAHSGILYNEEVDKLAKEALYRNENQGFNKAKNSSNEVEFIKDEDIFSKITGAKLSLKMNIYLEERVITSEELLMVVKRKWREKKRTIKEIKSMKSYYDAPKKRFVVNIASEEDEELIIIESSELNG